MSAIIEIYHAEIDYLTLTTWENEIRRHWNKLAEEHNPQRKRETSVQQYNGWLYHYPSGSIFVGQGEQKSMPHYLIKISGNMAEEMKVEAFHQRMAYQVECRRVDLQITVPEPRGWDQFELLKRVEKSGKTPGWVTSTDRVAGRTSTVYIGSWNTDRFSTVYVKLTSGNERLLRLETRYKRDRANALLPQLAKGELPDNFLRHELMNIIKDVPLRKLFEPFLIGEKSLSARVKIKSKNDKTSEWLLNQVLPTFKRIISESDSDGEVMYTYLDAIYKVIDNS